MRGSLIRWLGASLILITSGCLLPQPDTPPIVPTVGVPDTAPGGGKAGTQPIAPSPEASPTPSPSPSPSASPSPKNTAIGTIH